MKRLTATILGVILIGTLATGCSSEPDPNSWAAISAAQDAKPQWQKDQELKDRNMQFLCAHWRDATFNYSVKTEEERQKAFYKVYTWSMDSDFALAGRDLYEAYLADDGDKALAAGIVLGDACQNVAGL